MTEQVNNQLTRTEYAEYKGVSKPMVSKWARDNRLVLTPDEKFVLVAESDARIRLTASLNNSFNEKVGAEEKEKVNKIIEEKGLTELTWDVKSTQLDLETDDAEVLFRNARALREKAAALQAAAEHERFVGALVEKEQVEKLIFERGRQFRDGVMACSRRIAPDVIGKESIQEIEALIQKELRSMLEQFARLPIIE